MTKQLKDARDQWRAAKEESLTLQQQLHTLTAQVDSLPLALSCGRNTTRLLPTAVKEALHILVRQSDNLTAQEQKSLCR